MCIARSGSQSYGCCVEIGCNCEKWAPVTPVGPGTQARPDVVAYRERAKHSRPKMPQPHTAAATTRPRQPHLEWLRHYHVWPTDTKESALCREICPALDRSGLAAAINVWSNICYDRMDISNLLSERASARHVWTLCTRTYTVAISSTTFPPRMLLLIALWDCFQHVW